MIHVAEQRDDAVHSFIRINDAVADLVAHTDPGPLALAMATAVAPAPRTTLPDTAHLLQDGELAVKSRAQLHDRVLQLQTACDLAATNVQQSLGTLAPILQDTAIAQVSSQMLRVEQSFITQIMSRVQVASQEVARELNRLLLAVKATLTTYEHTTSAAHTAMAHATKCAQDQLTAARNGDTTKLDRLVMCWHDLAQSYVRVLRATLDKVQQIQAATPAENSAMHSAATSAATMLQTVTTLLQTAPEPGTSSVNHIVDTLQRMHTGIVEAQAHIARLLVAANASVPPADPDRALELETRLTQAVELQTRAVADVDARKADLERLQKDTPDWRAGMVALSAAESASTSADALVSLRKSQLAEVRLRELLVNLQHFHDNQSKWVDTAHKLCSCTKETHDTLRSRDDTIRRQGAVEHMVAVAAAAEARDIRDALLNEHCKTTAVALQTIWQDTVAAVHNLQAVQHSARNDAMRHLHDVAAAAVFHTNSGFLALQQLQNTFPELYVRHDALVQRQMELLEARQAYEIARALSLVAQRKEAVT